MLPLKKNSSFKTQFKPNNTQKTHIINYKTFNYKYFLTQKYIKTLILHQMIF